jgi:hypothetical protein
MKRDSRTLFRRLWKDRRGFALALVGAAMVGLTGMGTLSVDLAVVYFAKTQLQATANAAAMAGGAVLWEVNTFLPGETSSSQAVTAATTYSGVSSDKNAMAASYNVAMASGYPKLLCLTSTGVSCSTTSSPPTYNAIEVQETATVPLIFARMFGYSSVTLTATAMAGEVCPGGCATGSGLSPPPYNVMLIIDSTQSMATTTNSSCTVTGVSGNPSMFQCALAGAQTLLKQLNGTQDWVGLMTFPGLNTAAELPYDYCDPATSLSGDTAAYGNEKLGGSVSVNPPYYQIIGNTTTLDTTYSGSTAGTLSTSDNLVKAISVAGTPTSCGTTLTSDTQKTGLQDIGGQGTYYAGVLTYATTVLYDINQIRNLPPSHNVIILLSDGAANSTTVTNYQSGSECNLAVQAAQAATQAGYVVIAVAYGTEATGNGCTTPTEQTNSPYYGSPCKTMQNIASSPIYFYSETSAVSNGCTSADHPNLSSLSQIFGSGPTNAGSIPNLLGLQPVRLLAPGTT